jgi:hypothetical protein
MYPLRSWFGRRRMVHMIRSKPGCIGCIRTFLCAVVCTGVVILVWYLIYQTASGWAEDTKSSLKPQAETVIGDIEHGDIVRPAQRESVIRTPP